MSKLRQIAGKNIRRFRETRGMTQERLAELVNVSPSYIGYLERGKQSPSLKLLEKIANAFEVEASILLTAPDDMKNQELERLVALLSGKGTGVIKFLNEVAFAYFKSLNREEKN